MHCLSMTELQVGTGSRWEADHQHGLENCKRRVSCKPEYAATTTTAEAEQQANPPTILHAHRTHLHMSQLIPLSISSTWRSSIGQIALHFTSVILRYDNMHHLSRLH